MARRPPAPVAPLSSAIAFRTWCACSAHAVRVQCACSAHAVHRSMQSAVHMRCTCGAHAVRSAVHSPHPLGHLIAISVVARLVIARGGRPRQRRRRRLAHPALRRQGRQRAGVPMRLVAVGRVAPPRAPPHARPLISLPAEPHRRVGRAIARGLGATRRAVRGRELSALCLGRHDGSHWRGRRAALPAAPLRIAHRHAVEPLELGHVRDEQEAQPRRLADLVRVRPKRVSSRPAWDPVC